MDKDKEVRQWAVEWAMEWEDTTNLQVLLKTASVFVKYALEGILPKEVEK